MLLTKWPRVQISSGSYIFIISNLYSIGETLVLNRLKSFLLFVKDRKLLYERKLNIIVEKLERLPTSYKDQLIKDAIMYRIQVAIEAATDLVAMLVKDHGKQVSDDYTNLTILADLEIIPLKLIDELKKLNGLRNAIVPKYNHFEEDTVLKNLKKISKTLMDFVEIVEHELKPTLAQIKEDLNKLSKYEVVIFGSYCNGYFNQRSDIDIAIITRVTDPEKNKKIWWNLLSKAPEIYDLKVFELLPLELKIDIINNHIALFGNNLEISEYFYHFRKLWKDTQYRYYNNQFKNHKEKLQLLKLNKIHK